MSRVRGAPSLPGTPAAAPEGHGSSAPGTPSAALQGRWIRHLRKPCRRKKLKKHIPGTASHSALNRYQASTHSIERHVWSSLGMLFNTNTNVTLNAFSRRASSVFFNHTRILLDLLRLIGAGSAAISGSVLLPTLEPQTRTRMQTRDLR